MKKLMALLLLAALLISAIPALAIEDEEIVAGLVKEIWQADSGASLLFKDNGEGTYTSAQGAAHDGTWKLTDQNTIVLTYEQYGIREMKITLSTGSDWYLWANGSEYYQKSVRERKKKEAADAEAAAKAEADSKTHTLKWKEKVQLDFLEFQLNSCKIYRSKNEVLTDRSYTLQVEEGYKYLIVSGTISSSIDISSSGFHVQVTLDGKDTSPMDFQVLRKEDGTDSYLTSYANAGTSTRLYLAAKIPEKVARTYKKADLRISFFDQFSDYPQKESDGDFFFRLSWGQKQADASRKEAAKKVTYFEEKNKLPVPMSYVDVLLNNQTVSRDRKGKVTEVSYVFVKAYSDGDMGKLVSAYIQALKDAGLKVTSKKPSYNWTQYTIKSGKTTLATLSYTDDSTSFSIRIPTK